jgi:hypothetical protein
MSVFASHLFVFFGDEVTGVPSSMIVLPQKKLFWQVIPYCLHASQAMGSLYCGKFFDAMGKNKDGDGWVMGNISNKNA